MAKYNTAILRRGHDMQKEFDPFIRFFHFEQNYQLGILFDPSGSAPERQTHAMVIPDFVGSAEHSEDEPQYPPYISMIAKNFTENTVSKFKIYECDIFLIAHHHEYIIGKYQERCTGAVKGIFGKRIEFTKNLGDFEQEITQKLSRQFAQSWADYIQSRQQNNGIQLSQQATGKNMVYAQAVQQPFAKSKLPWLLGLSALFLVFCLSFLWGMGRNTAPGYGLNYSGGTLDKNATNAQLNATRDTLKGMGLDPGNAANSAACLTPQ